MDQFVTLLQQFTKPTEQLKAQVTKLSEELKQKDLLVSALKSKAPINIAEREEKLSKLQSQVLALQKKTEPSAEFKAQFSEQAAKLKLVSDQLKTVTETRDADKKAFDAQIAELTRAKTQLEQTLQSKHQVQLSKSAGALKAKSEELEALNQQITDLKKAQKTRERTNSEELKKIQEKYDHLSQIYNTSVDKWKKIESENAQLQALFKKCTQEKLLLKIAQKLAEIGKNRRIEKEKQEAAEKATFDKQAQQDLRHAQQNTKAAQNELAVLKKAQAVAETAEANLASLHDEALDKLQTQINAQVEEILTLKNERASNQEALTRLNKMRQLQESKLKELTLQIINKREFQKMQEQAHSARIQTLQTQNNELRTQFSDEERNFLTQRDKRAREHMRETEQYTKNLELERQKAKTCNDELLLSKTEVERFTSQIGLHDAKIVELERLKQDLGVQIASLTSVETERNKKLTDALSNEKSKNADVLASVSSKQIEIDSLNLELDKIKEDLQDQLEALRNSEENRAKTERESKECIDDKAANELLAANKIKKLVKKTQKAAADIEACNKRNDANVVAVRVCLSSLETQQKKEANYLEEHVRERNILLEKIQAAEVKAQEFDRKAAAFGDCERKNAEVSGNLQTCAQTLSETTISLEQTKLDLQQGTASAAELNRQIAENQRTIEECGSKRDACLQTLQDKNAESAKHQSALEAQTAAVKSCEAQKAQASASFQTCSESLKQKGAALELKERELQAANDAKSELERTVADNQNTLADCDRGRTEFSQQLDDTKAKLAAHQSILTTKDAELLAAKKLISEQAAQIKQLKDVERSKQALDAKIQELNAANEGLQTSLAALTSSEAAIKAQIISVTEKLKECTNFKSSLQTQLSASQSSEQESAEKVATLESQLASQTQSSDAAHSQQQVQHATELEALQRQLAQVTSEHMAQSKTIEENLATIEALHTKSRKVEDQRTELSDKLSVCTQKNQEKEAAYGLEVSTLNNTNHILQETNSEIKSNWDECERTKIKKIQQYKHINSQLQQAQKLANEIQPRLTELYKYECAWFCKGAEYVDGININVCKNVKIYSFTPQNGDLTEEDKIRHRLQSEFLVIAMNGYQNLCYNPNDLVNVDIVTQAGEGKRIILLEDADMFSNDFKDSLDKNEKSVFLIPRGTQIPPYDALVEMLPGEIPDWDIKQALGGAVQPSNEREHAFRYAHGIRTLALQVTQQTKLVGTSVTEIYKELRSALLNNEHIINLQAVKLRQYYEKYPQCLEEEAERMLIEPLADHSNVLDSDLLTVWKDRVHTMRKYEREIQRIVECVEKGTKETSWSWPFQKKNIKTIT